MKLEDFVRNLRQIDDGRDLDPEMLAGIYERIRSQAFRPGSDHVTQVMKVQQTIVSFLSMLTLLTVSTLATSLSTETLQVKNVCHVDAFAALLFLAPSASGRYSLYMSFVLLSSLIAWKEFDMKVRQFFCCSTQSSSFSSTHL